ncbi:hypothetical protein PVL29_009619 [Vitis rotundifolia]|uniref:SHSP domain-containing protein n=1 Tax=Vitis rotundifolia TaxID=103349 RepID=A0AA38ZSW4_VITRO|nr:hypothetical protein PVL29_009619 [Vitis rotundifolia]
MDAKAEATKPLRSYREFEPFCEWERKEDKDTLLVQLPPGFKKDHLKVLVSNQGLVRFSGECPADGNTWHRFQREIRVPRNCYMNGIQAKFLRGNLHIIMPKNTNSTAAQGQAAPPVGESQEQSKAKPKEEKGEGDEKAKVDESRNVEEGRNGVESSVSRLKMGFLVVALVVAFGAYAAYNYQYFINWTEK